MAMSFSLIIYLLLGLFLILVFHKFLLTAIGPLGNGTDYINLLLLSLSRAVHSGGGGGGGQGGQLPPPGKLIFFFLT